MKILTFLLLISISFGAIAAPILPANIPSSSLSNLENGAFKHVVLFWLKHPDSQEDRDKFVASLENFVNNSKYIQSMHLGTPASTDRTVIDKSYTYIMILTFDSKEEQDKYQDEAVHKQFIAESENLWEKVVVYDSENMWE